MQDNRKSSRVPGLTSCLLIAILTVVVIQFLVVISGGLYTVVPMDPGTSGLFGRVVLTNKLTGESWIVFPKGSAAKVSLAD